MFEIKITLSDIDYAGAAKTLFPLLKQKAENETAPWALVVRSIDMPDKETLNRIFSLLPQGVKDKLAAELLMKYSDKISEMLTTAAKDHGIDMEVKDVVVEKI